MMGRKKALSKLTVTSCRICCNPHAHRQMVHIAAVQLEKPFQQIQQLRGSWPPSQPQLACTPAQQTSTIRDSITISRVRISVEHIERMHPKYCWHSCRHHCMPYLARERRRNWQGCACKRLLEEVDQRTQAKFAPSWGVSKRKLDQFESQEGISRSRGLMCTRALF